MAAAWNASLGCYRLGRREYARLRRAGSAEAGGAPVAIDHPGFSTPVWARPGSTDASVFVDVLIRDLYGCVDAEPGVRLVLDAGANVGYSTLFFLARYPDAIVVALEPEPSNWDLAMKNLATFGDRVRLLRAALWPEEAALRVVSAVREDGHTVLPAAGSETGVSCMGVDPLTLLRQSGQERIGLFKCDIEGSEKELFEADPDPWLERTDAMLVEIHSEAARVAVYRAMTRHGFRSRIHREVHAFVRSERARG